MQINWSESTCFRVDPFLDASRIAFHPDTLLLGGSYQPYGVAFFTSGGGQPEHQAYSFS